MAMAWLMLSEVPELSDTIPCSHGLMPLYQGVNGNAASFSVLTNCLVCLISASGDDDDDLGKFFYYQSCTTLKDEIGCYQLPGSMRGQFNFRCSSIPGGEIQDSRGSVRPSDHTFAVKCPEFALTIPNFIY